MPEMGDNEVSLLRDLIATGHDALVARLESQKELVLERLTTQDKVLGDVLKEVRRTNGRVTTLEHKAAVDTGEREAHKAVKQHHFARLTLVVSTAAVLLSGAVGAVLALVLH